MGVNLAVKRWFGFYSMVVYAAMPMLIARIVTLVFNVEYHPPDGQKSSLAGPPADTNSKNGKRQHPCLSIDVARVLADCVGESCHDDHHTNPCRAKRPSGGFPHHDLPYVCVIKPLLWLGLI